MGMFDSVIVPCIKCNKDSIEFQTKVGDCILKEYTPNHVPMVIALALDGTSESCRTCGHTVTLHMPMKINEICMVVEND